jgi:parvulin-like peptidyl-prolyl isomerase
LFVQRGLELNVAASDGDTRAALAAAVANQVAAEAVAFEPSDRQAREYYLANQAVYASEGTMNAQDLSIPADRDPNAVRDAALTGASLDDLAARFGVRDAKTLRGREFYFAARLRLDPNLFAVAAALPDGAVSEPVALADGIHLVRMIENKPPVPRAFEEVRERVLNDHRRVEIERLTKDYEKYLAGRADILIAEVAP